MFFHRKPRIKCLRIRRPPFLRGTVTFSIQVARRLRGAAIRALLMCLAEFRLMAFLGFHPEKDWKNLRIFGFSKKNDGKLLDFSKKMLGIHRGLPWFTYTKWRFYGIQYLLMGYQWDVSGISMRYQWHMNGYQISATKNSGEFGIYLWQMGDWISYSCKIHGIVRDSNRILEIEQGAGW